MVSAYWNKEEETREAFVEIDDVRYYRTGDVIRTDEQGWFYFVDRTADTIKHKGYRVSSSEIEGVLQDHPAVLAACAVGVPDDKVGERIKAFVVLKGDVKGVTGYDLTRWCRDHLASYKVPHYIEFRDALPKSKVGKLYDANCVKKNASASKSTDVQGHLLRLTSLPIGLSCFNVPQSTPAQSSPRVASLIIKIRPGLETSC